MLKINQTFTKLFFLISLSLSLFSVASYFSFRLIIIDEQNLVLYNQVWMILGVFLISILLLLYFAIQKVRSELSSDVKEVQNYLDEISDKNYEAVIHIKYIHEFLEISLRLKNLIKRLNNKDSKKK